MKKTFITLITATCLLVQPLLATSVMEGRGQKDKVEAATPRAHAELGRAASEDEMTRALNVTEEASPAETATEYSTNSSKDQAASASSISEIEHQEKRSVKVRKQKRQKIRTLKLMKRLKKHEGGSSTVGILALVFGILGFILAWAIFPIGLLFAITAIVLGAIGMGRNRAGRGMAIAGLVLGILTLVIPILIVALLLAIIL